jgi:hypothetical protein
MPVPLSGVFPGGLHLGTIAKATRQIASPNYNSSKRTDNLRAKQAAKLSTSVQTCFLAASRIACRKRAVVGQLILFSWTCMATQVLRTFGEWPSGAEPV